MPPTTSDGSSGELEIAALSRRAELFRSELIALKTKLRPVADFWYPYDILSNFAHLDKLLTGANRKIFDSIRNGHVADIGAADGDNAFFLTTLGNTVDIIDHAQTNFNQLRGAKLLRTSFEQKVNIFEVDLDTHFQLPRNDYDLVLFLGILYHLKNPYYTLEALAHTSKHLLLSTKITRYASDRTTLLRDIPVAYLLDSLEANNDDTNYWIFSELGLRRILKRCGWDVQDMTTLGNTVNSDPSSAPGDERAFVYARSMKRR